MIYEILDDGGKAINVVTADADFMAQAFASKNYRPVTITPPPPEPEPAAPSRHIAAGALYLRFTFAERAAILLAGTVNPSADIKTQQLQAQVATLRADLLSSRTIDLDGAGLATGLGMLAILKVLEADWKDRVQLAPITDAERAYGQS